MHATRRLGRAVVMLLLAAVVAAVSCKRGATSSPAPTSSTRGAASGPTVRLYVLSTLAGAMEPCGCRKDMLGGVEHAAALLASQAEEAPHRVVVGAGPMFFMEPEFDADKKTQDLWKADAIAAALADMGVAAWAPGYNDFAAGVSKLGELSKRAGAEVLAANLEKPDVGDIRILTAGSERVGVAGVSRPKRAGALPDGVEAEDPTEALRRTLASLQKQGATVRVALVAADRGEALRLAERVPGFHVLVVGKPYDQGEGNDAPTPPVLVGKTLVVQAPNHLQAIGIVDLFVRGDGDFADGSGIAQAERRTSLERRIAALERRITEWEKAEGIDPADLAARKKDLQRLRREHSELSEPKPPAEGSYFRYRLAEVREELGVDPAVEERMQAYYRRVNEHNKVAFADHRPPPVPEGQSGYLGAEDCSNCHDEEHAFWKTTPHAKAYATLAKQSKQYNLDCVACHVTGYEKPGGATVAHVGALESVQCEVCHGPGSRHEDDPENPELIQRVPDKALCARCHHPPHVLEDWSVEDAWPKILGKGHGD